MTAHPERLERARLLLGDLGLDAVVVSDRADVRYLSGFRGEDTTLVIGRDKASIVTDSRFFEQVREETTGFELVAREGKKGLLAETAAAAAAALGGQPVLGYQASALTHADYRGLRRAHTGRLRDVRRRLSRLRMRKDEDEVDAIARACAVVDLALAVVAGEGLVGRTEREVAWRLREEYHDRGAEDESFATIVATGDHGAQGHAIPGTRRIKAGEFVVIDTGARVDGYCSDITRTFAAGRASQKLRRLYEVVLEAQLAGLAAVRPGAHGRGDVDAAARAVIERAGYGDRFGHGTGHGVGLEIHEDPGLGRIHGDRLEAGMVCTVEPGIYIEGEVGIRIEDTVLVTPQGAEALTMYPKELQVTD